MNKRIIISLAVILKLILASLICTYFWKSTTLIEIQQIPLYVLILSVAYIGLQMATRRISGVQNWWDWVYYIGLLSIMIPVTFANTEHEKLFHAITDYGTILLIIPVLVDGWHLVKPNSSK